MSRAHDQQSPEGLSEAADGRVVKGSHQWSGHDARGPFQLGREEQGDQDVPPTGS